MRSEAGFGYHTLRQIEPRSDRFGAMSVTAERDGASTLLKPPAKYYRAWTEETRGVAAPGRINLKRDVSRGSGAEYRTKLLLIRRFFIARLCRPVSLGVIEVG